MRRICRTAIAGAVLILALPAAGRAQSEVLIRSEPACASCRIELQPVVKIGDVDEPGAVGGPAAIARDGRGFYYVVSAETPHEIDVFSARGEWVRTLGREGGGPGEYRVISAIQPVAGDTVLVFDVRNGRLTVLSPAWEAVRTVPMHVNLFSTTRLTGGRLAVAGVIRTAESLGYPLHMVGSDGSLTSFGAEDPVFRPDMFYAIQRRVAAAPDGLLWASHALQYVIELWDPRGRMLERLVRKAEWFPPQFQQRNRTREVQEYPVIRAVRQDAAGRLWVLINVNEPDWYEGLGEPVGSPDGRYYEIIDADQVWGTRIEVLDPEAGRVIASTYTDEYLMRFLGDRHTVAYREDDGGVPRRVVFRINLTNPSRRR